MIDPVFDVVHPNQKLISRVDTHVGIHIRVSPKTRKNTCSEKGLYISVTKVSLDIDLRG